MTLITGVHLRAVLDSRGNPTVEAEVTTESGGFGRAAAPSGASTGEHEAVERPVPEAIAAAREHAIPRLVGEAYVGDQREVDAILRAADGTENFAELGANSAVAISMAVAKAAADVLGTPLFQHLGGTFRGNSFPIPLGNVIGGGEHADDATAIQEFLVAPVGAPNIEEAVFANAAVHDAVADKLRSDGVSCGKGDEGAWAPPISDDRAFEVLDAAIEAVEAEVGFELAMGLDVAATELYDEESETYAVGSTDRDTAAQIDAIVAAVDEYDLVYVEDPLEEEDFEGFAELTARVDDRTLICGDDLFVTNTERIQRGIEAGSANSVLIKPNQIGTLSDTVDAIELARRNSYEPVVSHRSGETEDATIAHIAVATDVPYIKTGAVGGERTAKLNELIRIGDIAT